MAICKAHLSRFGAHFSSCGKGSVQRAKGGQRFINVLRTTCSLWLHKLQCRPFILAFWFVCVYDFYMRYTFELLFTTKSLSQPWSENNYKSAKLIPYTWSNSVTDNCHVRRSFHADCSGTSATSAPAHCLVVQFSRSSLCKRWMVQYLLLCSETRSTSHKHTTWYNLWRSRFIVELLISTLLFCS